MTTLNTYIRSADEIVSNAADLTVSAMAAYKTKQITSQEYDEIIEDIFDLSKITTLTNDMKRQNFVAKAFDEMKSIATLLTSI